MWILTWKTYKLAKFATFISIVGALLLHDHPGHVGAVADRDVADA